MKTRLPDRNVKILFCIFLSSILLAQSPAAERTRIYLAEDEHTDLMWTADGETYERVFVEMLDHHLKLAEQTKEQPPALRHRFNCDGSLWLRAYEKRKTPEEFARLIECVRSGTLSVPLNTAVSCYGAQPAEAVLRGMSYAGMLERRHGLRLPLAVAMENQTLPLGLASLFAGAGARYSWRGVCGCASRLDNAQLGQRPHEIYWWTGHDGQRVLLKWHSLAPAGNQHSGGYAEAFDPASAVRFLSEDSAFLQRYRAPGATEPYRVRGAFGFGWDGLDRKTGQPYPPDETKYPVTSHFHEVARTMSDAQRQVIVSNEQDFFADFEKAHGAELPMRCVTHGNEWDLYSASMSETSARVKRAVERLRGAELLATLVSLKRLEFWQKHQEARNRANWALGLFWEHNWTADGPITRQQRAAWQNELATDIEGYVNALHKDAVNQFGSMISASVEAKRFFVLNPLSWPRSDVADFTYAGPLDIHVRDLATGNDVPYQIEGERLRILAIDVPPAGYKVFEIQAGSGNAPTDDAASFDGSVFENEAVKLIIERDGALRSFISKHHAGTELAATLDGLRLNDLAPDSDEGEPLQIESHGPVSVTLRARSSAGLPHTTNITLVRGSDRVDIHNEVTANFADTRHWSFTFDLEAPVTHTEEVGAILQARPQAAGGDYADTHARCDYLTVNHFADLSDGARGVTISNADLSFAKLGYSEPEILDWGTPQLHFLAGGQVDGDKLGIPAQGGCQRFTQRFALRAHGGYEAAAAMRFALEHQNPLITGMISGGSGVYPETTHSLLHIDHPEVLLCALKPHEDGIEHGIITRLWNVAEKPVQAVLKLTPGIQSAHHTTHLERDITAAPLDEQGSLPTRLSRQQMQTWRLLPVRP